MDISSKIEALLFWKAEPISLKKLAEFLKVDHSQIIEGLSQLEKRLDKSGLTLVQDDNEVMLGTAKELSSFIEEITKEEIGRDLGKAGLETLSIILYQGPISRADIDYIRGVNSQFIIRNLLIRGLIDRVENPGDARIFLYKPTLALLSHLGVSKVKDLPEYDQVRKEIENFKKTEGSSQN
ncbi:SMC-Scp complex subunit ScpB [Candidatus Woesebacteria bacterium]|nr:SMC-Scp complex subunit ScpB [Candidatus Woesebacteria bacterium]